VRWKGGPALSLKEEYSKQLVYLGHAPAVKDDLSAAENLEIACTLAGIPIRQDSIREALARFGLPEDGVFLKRLSQGQRKRAALARLWLCAEIPLWFLDEPFAALDAAAVEFTRGLMRAHVARGAAVVYTTHQEDGLQESRVVDLAAAAA
jgi:heme exporter protein A